jgi:hypothetical protein
MWQWVSQHIAGEWSVIRDPENLPAWIIWIVTIAAAVTLEKLLRRARRRFDDDAPGGPPPRAGLTD